MMMEHLDRSWIGGFLCFATFCVNAEARLGETPNELAYRYGRPEHPPKNGIQRPLLENAQTRIYKRDLWIIRAAFLDIASPAIRIEYKKKNVIGLSDEDVDAILSANAQGLQWRRLAYQRMESGNPAGEMVMGNMLGLKEWTREDGARAYTPYGAGAIVLELPEAAKHESRLSQKRHQQEIKRRPKF